MTNALPYEVRTYATREEWLQDRRHGIGGSDVAAVLGLSAYMTPLELYHLKRGEISAPPREGEWLEWGNLLEEPIARRFERETGRKVVHPAALFADAPMMLRATDGAYAGPYVVLVDKARPWRRTSIDRFFEDTTGERGTLEIKNVSEWAGKDWLKTGVIPDGFQLQVQHGLGITQLAAGSFAALIGGNRFKYDDIAHDEKLVALVNERIDEFWRRVELGDPPPVTADDKEVLRALYPSDTGETVTLAPDLIAVDEALADVKAKIKDLGKTKALLENQIQQAIGSASVGVLPNGNAYTFKTIARKGYTVEPTSYRDFRRKVGANRAPGGVLPASVVNEDF
jgi:putative phage-type endonuclease